MSRFRFPAGWSTRPATLTAAQRLILASKPGTHWTDQQWLALGELKEPNFSPGVARGQFVNECLCADGSVAGGDEAVEAMLAAAEKAMRPAEFAPFDSAREFVQMHLDQERFLFVVDAQGVPQVYFQCHVDHNPDVPGTTAHAAFHIELAERLAQRRSELGDDPDPSAHVPLPPSTLAVARRGAP